MSEIEGEIQAMMKRLKELELRSTGSSLSESPFQQTETVERLIAKFAPPLEIPKVPVIDVPETDPDNPEPIAQTSRSIIPKPQHAPTTKLPSIDLPKFDGSDFEEFLKRYERWLRLSGLRNENDQVKCDWLIEACVPKIRRLVETIVDQHDSDLVAVLKALTGLFPKLENDLTLRARLEKLSPLPSNPDPESVAQLILEISEVFSRLSATAISDQDKLLILVRKIHGKTWSEMRSDRYYKSRTSNFYDLKEALLEKAQEDWLERNLTQQKKANPQSDFR
jgi:hypothetical protein